MSPVRVVTADYPALEAGLVLVLIPIAVGSFVARGISFPLIAKIARRSFVGIALALEAVGLGGLGLAAAFTGARRWPITLATGVGLPADQVTAVTSPRTALWPQLVLVRPTRRLPLSLMPCVRP